MLEWQGARIKNYGAFKVRGRMLKAHRVAFFLATGLDPVEGILRHKCDNPPCCNPDCLITGTHASNAADRTERNRSATGARNGSRRHPERLTRGDAYWTRQEPQRAARNLKDKPRAKGERQHSAKLTESQVLEIRRLHVLGDGTYALSLRYGISWASTNKIIKRITWKHI